MFINKQRSLGLFRAWFTRYRITFHAGSFFMNPIQQMLQSGVFTQRVVLNFESRAYRIRAEPCKQNRNPT